MKHLKKYNERIDSSDMDDVLDALNYLTDSTPKFIETDETKYQDGLLAVFYEYLEKPSKEDINKINQILLKINYTIISHDTNKGNIYFLIASLDFLSILKSKKIKIIENIELNKKSPDHWQAEVMDTVAICINTLGPKLIDIWVWDNEIEMFFSTKVEANLELIRLQFHHLGMNKAIKQMVSSFDDFDTIDESIEFKDKLIEEDPKHDSFVRKGDIVSLLFDNNKRIGTLHYRIKDDTFHGIWADVSKEFQGMKYGNKIMEEVVKRAKDSNCKNVQLEVMKNNIVAFNLYKKFGFEVVNDDGIYYEMRREL